jgi:hypothetical protein
VRLGGLTLAIALLLAAPFDARIAAAEQELEKAEFQESAIETRGDELGVPSRCFDDSDVRASDE